MVKRCTVYVTNLCRYTKIPCQTNTKIIRCLRRRVGTSQKARGLIFGTWLPFTLLLIFVVTAIFSKGETDQRQVDSLNKVNKMEPHENVSKEQIQKLNVGDLWSVSPTSDRAECQNNTSGVPNIERRTYLPNLKNPCWYEVNSQFICLPYFFLAGQPKCGTTDLFESLALHPEIVKARKKEPHWMSKFRFKHIDDKLVHKNMTKYYNNFKEATAVIHQAAVAGNTNFITVDASASTLWYNENWMNLTENCGLKEPKYINAHAIHYLLPQAKIIIILRNPTERLYSDYLFFRHETSPSKFHEEVVTVIKDFKTCLLNNPLRACVYTRINPTKLMVRLHIGLYDVFIQDWLKVFPRQQLYILRLEDYKRQRLAIVKSIFRFLEIKSITPEVEMRIRNAGIANTNFKKKSKAGPMLNETKVLLDNFYEPHNRNLGQLLGDTRYLWL